MDNLSVIYHLKMYSVFGVIKYPMELEDLDIGFYSSKERMEEALRDYLSKPEETSYNDEKETVICFEASELTIDNEFRLIRKYVYDSEGKYYGYRDVDEEPREFLGRSPESCRFKVGDIVQFRMGDKLHLGIIAYEPLTPEFIQSLKAKGTIKGLVADQSDDSYVLLWGENKFDHSHPQECELFWPVGEVNASDRENLLRRLNIYLKS